MKRIFCLAIVVGVLFSVPAFADPGVVLEAKGAVKISQGGGIIAAKSGTQFNDGATISVPSGGAATLMFSNGAIKKITSGQSFTAVKGPSTAGNSGIIRGISMAYGDATTKTRGPVVHGMVKGAGKMEPSQQPHARSAGNTPIPPQETAALNNDLRQVDSMGLDSDGRALLTAQVYYKYRQYKSMVDELLPVYKTQNPPSDMVKKLLALGYEKMGRLEDAGKFR
jgi:hypothetical protein